MNGARIPPILAHVELPPSATFRITVGNCSAEKMYIVPYDADMANFPIMANVTVSQLIAKTYHIHTFLLNILIYIFKA